MNKFESNLEQLKEIEVNGFAYELIREVLLPDILGQDHSSMMYFAGKLLARNFLKSHGKRSPNFSMMPDGELSRWSILKTGN